jgi:hypothetical protein
MRNLLTHLLRRLGKVHAAILGFSGGFLMATAAFALVLPPSFAPRQFQTQQTHYLRFTVNWNSCVPVGNCSVKVGALPYNAYLLRISSEGTVAFGSTTNLISLGTTSGGTNIMAAVTGFEAATNATTRTIVAANAGVGQSTTGVGNGSAQTGTNGGFDVWANMTLTGASPSAGQAIFVIEYAAPNDGTCAPVPMGATATAC